MANKIEKITASEGKVFRRIEDQMIYGKEIYLGYSHYIGGKKLDTPHKDVASDFEEIDEQVDKMHNILSGNTLENE